jgi:hypothetical protein
VVSTGKVADDRDREEMVAFAEAMVGLHFGWITMFFSGMNIILGSHLAVGLGGRTVCSGLVARCLERTSLINIQEPDSVLPADLARMFGVQHGGA